MKHEFNASSLNSAEPEEKKIKIIFTHRKCRPCMPPGSKYEILDPGHGFAFENGKLTFRCQCSTFFRLCVLCHTSGAYVSV